MQANILTDLISQARNAAPYTVRDRGPHFETQYLPKRAAAMRSLNLKASFLPRLFDTLIGSVIAGLTVFLFLPDWQGRRLNKVLANTLTCNSIYLRQIMQQYAAGKSDDLAYRLARRNAHNADAALSTTLANMLMEPGQFRKEADVGFRFLVLSHTLLSYLSGLGAHRETQLPADVREHLIDGAGKTLAASIDEIATGLANKQPISIQSDAEEAWLRSWNR